MGYDHHHVAVIFGILGNVISFLVFLAPLPTFIRICKKRSTESFQSLPYQVSLFSCMLWLYYATIKKDAMLLLTINSFGVVVQTIYISLFFAFATKEKRIAAMKLFVSVNLAFFSLILLVTHFAIKTQALQVLVVGWICVAISVAVFAAPLMIIARVIRTKSVEFMPFTLSLCLTISAVMWFGYGLFLRDICIAIPNVVGFGLGMLQMIVYAIYRENKRREDNEQGRIIRIVVLSPLAVSEVHPVTTEPLGPLPEEVEEDEEMMSKVTTTKVEKPPPVENGETHVVTTPADIV